MGNHANTSLNVDYTFMAGGKEENTTTTPFEQTHWDELINNLKMDT
jgi:hypothetical protein